MLRRRSGSGRPFRTLGITYDNQLWMHEGIEKLAAEGGRVCAISPAAKLFSIVDAVRLYKSQVLSYIAAGVAGYHYASPYALAPLDAAQFKFLRECGLDERTALLSFKLAPLVCRRDIALLRILHRFVIGDGPAAFHDILRRVQRRDGVTRLSTFKTQQAN